MHSTWRGLNQRHRNYVRYMQAQHLWGKIRGDTPGLAGPSIPSAIRAFAFYHTILVEVFLMPPIFILRPIRVFLAVARARVVSFHVTKSVRRFRNLGGQASFSFARGPDACQCYSAKAPLREMLPARLSQGQGLSTGRTRAHATWVLAGATHYPGKSNSHALGTSIENSHPMH
ncbi:hypothetical protein BC827DRAFT_162101 [Russula dissimulans]|nr:hypothetical protein BC827DRAFT_162101 [Russula dissimulans]